MKALFFLMFFFLFNQCNFEKESEPERYIIPDNYTGVIVVFFNQPLGSPPVYKDKCRIYTFDSLGVFITQNDGNEGVHYDVLEKKKFYYSNGKQIPYRVSRDSKIPHDTIQAYRFIIGSIGKIHFLSCIIDKYNSKRVESHLDEIDHRIEKYKKFLRE